MTVELPEERTKTMRIDEASIDHNVVKIIESLVENCYEMIDKDGRMERRFMLMTLGKIVGVLDMAEAMKEVLKA